MRHPDWSSCTEEQLWKYIGFHLAKENIDCILVGGAVVAIYSNGAYRSGDLDFIAARNDLTRVKEVLEELGFKKVRGRHFEHPECNHLILEFPPGPISIGVDYRIEPRAVEVEGQIIKIFSPTDCIRDRLASYIHFKARECLEQAVLVGKSQPFDLAKIRAWCKSEGAQTAFDEFITHLRGT